MGFFKGFADMGKSLGTPSSRGRPRIAQLPEHRPEIGNINTNLDGLKMRGLRGRDIRGRRTKR